MSLSESQERDGPGFGERTTGLGSIKGVSKATEEVIRQNYDIEPSAKPFATGGQGNLFLVRTKGEFPRKRVLKVAKDLDPDLRTAFIEEFRLLEADGTPASVCKCYSDNPGKLPAGVQPFLVLEYLSGDTIDTVADKKVDELGQRDVTACLELFEQYCRDFAELGKLKVGDIKPGHTIVNRHGKLRFCDLGAARPVSDVRARSTKSTHWHDKEYSPQSVSMDGKPTTKETDIHCVCRVGYRLLTGMRPLEDFKSDIGILTNWEDRLKENGVPASCRSVLLKGLVDPHDVGDDYPYRSTLEIADQLQRIRTLETEARLKRQLSSSYRLYSWVAAVSVLAVFVLGFIWHQKSVRSQSVLLNRAEFVRLEEQVAEETADFQAGWVQSELQTLEKQKAAWPQQDPESANTAESVNAMIARVIRLHERVTLAKSINSWISRLNEEIFSSSDQSISWQLKNPNIDRQYKNLIDVAQKVQAHINADNVDEFDKASVEIEQLHAATSKAQAANESAIVIGRLIADFDTLDETVPERLQKQRNDETSEYGQIFVLAADARENWREGEWNEARKGINRAIERFATYVPQALTTEEKEIRQQAIISQHATMAAVVGETGKQIGELLESQKKDRKRIGELQALTTNQVEATALAQKLQKEAETSLASATTARESAESKLKQSTADLATERSSRTRTEQELRTRDGELQSIRKERNALKSKADSVAEVEKSLSAVTTDRDEWREKFGVAESETVRLGQVIADIKKSETSGEVVYRLAAPNPLLICTLAFLVLALHVGAAATIRNARKQVIFGNQAGTELAVVFRGQELRAALIPLTIIVWIVFLLGFWTLLGSKWTHSNIRTAWDYGTDYGLLCASVCLLGVLVRDNRWILDAGRSWFHHIRSSPKAPDDGHVHGSNSSQALDDGLVQCSMCPTRLSSEELTEHELKSCPNRKIPCKYCGASVKAVGLSTHVMKKCPKHSKRGNTKKTKKGKTGKPQRRATCSKCRVRFGMKAWKEHQPRCEEAYSNFLAAIHSFENEAKEHISEAKSLDDLKTVSASCLEPDSPRQADLRSLFADCALSKQKIRESVFRVEAEYQKATERIGGNSQDSSLEQTPNGVHSFTKCSQCGNPQIRPDRIEDHKLKSCPKRPKNCDCCGQLVEWVTRKSHIEEDCPGRVACPTCRKRVDARTMKIHEANCPGDTPV